MDVRIAFGVALAVACIVCGVLFCIPVRLRVRLQGQGEPNGVWALAGGAELGPVALSGLAAHGMGPSVQLYAFGKRIWQRALGGAADDHEAAAAKPSNTQALRKARARMNAGYERLRRWFDPLDLLLFVTTERKRVLFGFIEIDLHYSFEDVALTGKIMGLVFVLSGALPAVTVRQNVSWESIDRARAALTGEIKVWPGLLLVDTLCFVLRNVRRRRQYEKKRDLT